MDTVPKSDHRYRNFLFILAIGLGICIRVYLAVYTSGTADMAIWEYHVEQIQEHGLIRYSHLSHLRMVYNHPPLMSALGLLLKKLAVVTDVPFCIYFRLFFSGLDFLTAYLFHLISRNKIIPVLFLLNPMHFIHSAYHGNTDSGVALIVTAAVLMFIRRNYLMAGLILGCSASIKWAALIVSPVLFFCAPGMRNKSRLVAGTLSTLLFGYLYLFMKDPWILEQNILGYGSFPVNHLENYPMPWGNLIWFSRLNLESVGLWMMQHNTEIVLASVLVYALGLIAAREEQDIPRSVGAVFVLFYGLTNYFCWQYFAWIGPMLFALDWKWSIPAATLVSVYIYGMTSYFTSSHLLMGKWDYLAYTSWPAWVVWAKDAAVLLFFLWAVLILCIAIRRIIGGIVNHVRNHGVYGKSIFGIEWR